MAHAWFNHDDHVGRLDEIGNRHCVFHDYGACPSLRAGQVPTTAAIGRRPKPRVIDLSFADAEVMLLGEGWTPRPLRAPALR